MHDRRDLKGILKDAAYIRSRSMSVLHITSKTEGKESRLGKIQIDIASHIVLCKLELGVKCSGRICRNDTRLVIYSENEAVTKKFGTSTDVCADMRACRKVIGDKVKPICRRVEVRILAAASLVDLLLRIWSRHR